MDLGVKGSTGNVHEHVTGELGLGNLEALEELEGLSLGLLDTISDDTRMNTLAEESLSLAHEFTDEEHVRRGAIADDVILSSGCTSDHSGCWVLDLHLVEQNTTIFGELDLAGATNKPIFQKRRVRLTCQRIERKNGAHLS